VRPLVDGVRANGKIGVPLERLLGGRDELLMQVQDQQDGGVRLQDSQCPKAVGRTSSSVARPKLDQQLQPVLDTTGRPPKQRHLRVEP
jgi:hypothetical protein